MPRKVQKVARSGEDLARLLASVLEGAAVASDRLPSLLRYAEAHTGLCFPQTVFTARALSLPSEAPAPAPVPPPLDGEGSHTHAMASPSAAPAPTTPAPASLPPAAPSTAAVPGSCLRPCTTDPLSGPPLLRIPQHLLRVVFDYLPRSSATCCLLVSQAVSVIAQFRIWRAIDTDEVHNTKVGRYLMAVANVEAQPQFLRLRLGRAECGVLQWVANQVNVAQLSRVELRISGAPHCIWLQDSYTPDLCEALGRATGARGMLYGVEDVDESSEDMDTTLAWQVKLFAALERLPALDDLKLQHVGFTHYTHADPALNTVALEKMCALRLRKLAFKFSSFEQLETIVKNLCLLQELQVFTNWVDDCSWDRDGAARLISRSLESVSFVDAEKRLFIGHVDCPRLRTVKGRGLCYGTGFVALRDGLQYTNEPGVYTEADGYRFCWGAGEYITFGPEGRPDPSCQWILV